MATTLEHIKGRDMPAVLARPLKISPNKTYTMTIEVEEEAQVERQSPEKQAIDPALDLLNYSADMGVEDLAEQHDHYLYGHPKR